VVPFRAALRCQAPAALLRGIPPAAIVCCCGPDISDLLYFCVTCGDEGCQTDGSCSAVQCWTHGAVVPLLLLGCAAGPVIAGAINIPLDALSDTVRSGQLDKHITDSHVVVVCGSGQRSAQATVRLGKVFGFQHVSNVAGGMAAWLKMQQELRSPGGGGCGCGGGGCH
jgi:rhodanese-related sulfurtransferase